MEQLGKKSLVQFMADGSITLAPAAAAAVSAFLRGCTDEEHTAAGLDETQSRICLDVVGACSEVKQAMAVLRQHGLNSVPTTV